MSIRKRPAAAAPPAPPKKRLRGKQENASYNESLPKEFLAWRAQRIYAAYKNLGGAQLMENLADDLALTEPNPAHYAEHMGVYIDGRLAAECQPPIGRGADCRGVEAAATDSSEKASRAEKACWATRQDPLLQGLRRQLVPLQHQTSRTAQPGARRAKLPTMQRGALEAKLQQVGRTRQSDASAQSSAGPREQPEHLRGCLRSSGPVAEPGGG